MSSFKSERDLWFYLIEPVEGLEAVVREEIHFILRKSVEDKVFSSNSGDVCIRKSDLNDPFEFQSFNWDLIRQVEEKFKNKFGTKLPTLEALNIVKAEMKSQSKKDTYKHHRIIFFTEFKDPINDSGIKNLAQDLKASDIFLSIVTIDPKEMNSTQNLNYTKFKEHLSINKSGRVNTELDTRKQILNTATKKVVRLSPWNCLFDIGPNFSIQVRGYSSIRENKSSELKNALMKENKSFIPQAPLRNGDSTQQPGPSQATQGPSNAFQRENGNSVGPTQNNQPFSESKPEAEILKNLVDKEKVIKDKVGNLVDVEETTKGYMYGDQIVPLPGDGEGYNSGEKCLKLLLICPKTNIKPFYLIGDGVTRFFPKQDTVIGYSLQVSELYFNALLKVLNKLERVVIVRKVYRVKTAPKIGVLSPDLHMGCLVYNDICYSDNISIHNFPKLTSSNSNSSDFGLSAKEEAMDELINAMSMGDFNPQRGPADPNVLNIRDQIARKIVPTNIKQDHLMKNGLELFFENFVISENLTNKLKSIFPLEDIKEEKNTFRPAGAKIFRKRDRDVTSPDMIEEKKIKVEECDVQISEPMDQDDGLNTDDLLDEL